MKFKEKLIVERKGKNFSQEKLAEIIGVSRQAVAKWEVGESLPEVEKLIALSDLFRVSIDSLVKDAGDENCTPATLQYASPDDSFLFDFLVRAKKATYAGKGAECASSRPASRDLQYTENDHFYYDTYLGGEKFSGEEAVWKNGIPLWSMNYIGRVLDEGFSGDFLKECLALGSPLFPCRGPLLHRNGDFTYHCRLDGEFSWFSGCEEIYCNGRKVYECLFHGGDVK